MTGKFVSVKTFNEDFGEIIDTPFYECNICFSLETIALANRVYHLHLVFYLLSADKVASVS